MPNKYIRFREDIDKYQVRIYNDLIRHSSTHETLEEAIRVRDSLIPGEDYAQKPRILIIDIETTPILAYVWRTWKENIYPEQILEDWKLLCFGYKWLWEKEVFTEDIRSGEQEIAEKLFYILDEADVIVAHNGKKFDIPRINSKLLEFNFPRPSPFKVVDTLRVARKHFSFTSNKLDYISKSLGGRGKIEHEGIALWKACIEGDQDAWQRMLEYNKRDIFELEKVYVTIRGWDSSHPNLGHYYNDGQLHCVSCGSTDLKEAKDVYTRVSKFKAFRCELCGQIVRSRTRIDYTEVTNVL